MKFVAFSLLLAVDLVLGDQPHLVPLTGFTGKSLWTDSYPYYDWKTADAYCRKENMNLATLTQTEQEQLKQVQPGASDGSFTGGQPAKPPTECPKYDFRTGTINGAHCTNKLGILCVCHNCNSRK